MNWGYVTSLTCPTPDEAKSLLDSLYMALQLGAYWQAAVSLAVLIAYARISLLHLALM